jgi:transposase-like protein
MTLTEEQQGHYLTHSGECPYCGSTDLEGLGFEVSGGEAWQEVLCNHCERRWFDVYELKKIEEVTK